MFRGPRIGIGIGISGQGGGGANTILSASSVLGTEIIDDSGNGYNIDIFNPCTYFGNSAYFDYGTGVAEESGAMTISCFIKGESDTALPVGFGRGTAVSGTYDYLIGIKGGLSSGELTFQIAEDATTVHQVTYSLPNHDTEFHHVMGVYSPGNYLRLYVDGVQVAENTTSIPASQYTHVTNPFTVGQTSNGGADFTGTIFDCRVYSAIKTYSEIMANDTTSLSFWDMMNSFANTKDTFGQRDGKSFAITGQVGEMSGFNLDFEYQNNIRHNLGYTKVEYTHPVAGGRRVVFIPYDTSGSSQYASVGPVWDAGETTTEMPYDANAIIQNWGESFEFNTGLISTDTMGYLFKPDNTARKLTYDLLNSNVGDYFIVTTGTNKINSITINDTGTAYSEAEVFLLWGQSNMVGVGEDTPSNTGDLTNYIYTESGLELMNFTSNNNQYPEVTAQHGLEIALSERLYTLRSTSDVFVKVAKGNIGMETNEGWNISNKYNYTDILYRSIDEAMAFVCRELGKKPVINWAIQYQGENDATQEDTSLRFSANLTAFYDALESHIGNTSLKKVVIKIADTFHTYYQNVKDQTDSFVAGDANAYSIDGGSYAVKVDNVHHTSTGYNNLGIAVANLIEST